MTDALWFIGVLAGVVLAILVEGDPARAEAPRWKAVATVVCGVLVALAVLVVVP